MGVNRFVGRNRGSRRFSRKTGRRKYAGSKKLKRIARRARYRRSAGAQSRQIRQIAGSLASTKGKLKREHPDSVSHFIEGEPPRPLGLHANVIARPFKKAAIGLARRAASNYDDRVRYAFAAYDWLSSLAGPIHDHSDML